MVNTAVNYANVASGPAVDILVITPSDTQDLPMTVRALKASADGVVRITTLLGNVRDLPVTAGIMESVGATRVWATSTTATGIVGYV